jgi:DNA-binding NarL/FixJ family response regulator
MAIRVLLADDHDTFRETVKLILESCTEIRVVAEASCGRDAIALAREHQPDVALLDVRMEPVNGLQAIPEILRESPKTAILMVSMYADNLYVTRSMEAGARGYLLKDSLDDMLVAAVLSARQGKCSFGAP